MGGQGRYSVSADENKILIITIQAAKYSFFYTQGVFELDNKYIYQVKHFHSAYSGSITSSHTCT